MGGGFHAKKVCGTFAALLEYTLDFRWGTLSLAIITLRRVARAVYGGVVSSSGGISVAEMSDGDLGCQ